MSLSTALIKTCVFLSVRLEPQSYPEGSLYRPCELHLNWSYQRSVYQIGGRPPRCELNSGLHMARSLLLLAQFSKLKLVPATSPDECKATV